MELIASLNFEDKVKYCENVSIFDLERILTFPGNLSKKFFDIIAYDVLMNRLINPFSSNRGFIKESPFYLLKDVQTLKKLKETKFKKEFLTLQRTLSR